MHKSAEDLNSLVTSLHEIGSIKFGTFQLKTGITSPIYFDLRLIISHPELLKHISSLIWKKSTAENLSFDVVCGIPYTALPVATILSSLSSVPMILKRKEAKSYGTKQMIEGSYQPSQKCLLIEDVVTSGSSVVETAKVLRDHGLVVSDVISILNREQGARENLKSHGITLHSILNVTFLLNVLHKSNILSTEKHSEIREFLNQNSNLTSKDLAVRQKLDEANWLEKIPCSSSRALVDIMIKKKSNLCISFDLNSWTEVIEAVERLAPFICLAKTHTDTYNFESCDQVLKFRHRILELSVQYSFLILEDRKYCDIGSTVEKQLHSKPFEVSKWAHMVTAHGIPGPGLLKSISRIPNLSVVLIAQMSSEGNLATKISSYCNEVYELANGYESVVAGFVAQGKVGENKDAPRFLQFTPGVSLVSKGDGLGQQYSTVEEAVENRGADVIIVGRGILQSPDEAQAAVASDYQKRAWNSWSKRVLQDS